MISAELSDLLDDHEKNSVLNAISASDKIVASGICRFLTANGGNWDDDTPPGVALFIKNSSERYYKITVIEPSTDPEWEPTRQFDHVLESNEFENFEKVHGNLLTFHVNDDPKQYGLNFFDILETIKFHDAIKDRDKKAKLPIARLDGKEKKPEKKEKKEGFIKRFFRPKKKNKLEIGEPTDFKHVEHAGLEMTTDQQELYELLMSKLTTNSEEDKEIVKKLVVTNENKFRQSMMIKSKNTTPKDVKKNKKSSKKKDVIQEEDEVVVIVPKDPLNPDWGNDTAATSINYRKAQEIVTASTPIKYAHTLASSTPSWSRISTVEEKVSTGSSHFESSPSTYPTPRKDTYTPGKEAHNLYRFETEAPPQLPSRSASRAPVVREDLNPSTPPPRLPSHRQSYRWATDPSESTYSSRKNIETHAEIKLSPPRQTSSIRQAPPPPKKAPVVEAQDEEYNHSRIETPPASTSASHKSSIPPSPPPPPPPPPPPAPPAAPPASAVSMRPTSIVPEINDDRRSLLDAIRNVDKSSVLRKTSDTESNPRNSAVLSPTSGGNMIDEIQQFLDARRNGINPSDSEEGTDSDGSWSD